MQGYIRCRILICFISNVHFHFFNIFYVDGKDCIGACRKQTNLIYLSSLLGQGLMDLNKIIFLIIK